MPVPSFTRCGEWAVGSARDHSKGLERDMEVRFTLEATADGSVLATFADPDDLWGSPAAEFAAGTADDALAGLLGLLTFNDALAAEGGV